MGLTSTMGLRKGTVAAEEHAHPPVGRDGAGLEVLAMRGPLLERRGKATQSW